MTKPIFANTTHQIVVNDYLNLMLSFVKEISSETRYNNFKEVLQVIIEYHNSYGKDVDAGNWDDWLTLIPSHTSVMVNGYFAGIQNIVMRAIGIPFSMFTAVFALARTAGWVAHWNEMMISKESKIGRPRQVYKGKAKRDIK